MKTKCPESCPCRIWPRRTLSVQERLQIESNHFDHESGALIQEPETTAVQGDVHWLDWHETESR